MNDGMRNLSVETDECFFIGISWAGGASVDCTLLPAARQLECSSKILVPICRWALLLSVNVHLLRWKQIAAQSRWLTASGAFNRTPKWCCPGASKRRPFYYSIKWIKKMLLRTETLAMPGTFKINLIDYIRMEDFPSRCGSPRSRFKMSMQTSMILHIRPSAASLPQNRNQLPGSLAKELWPVARTPRPSRIHDAWSDGFEINSRGLGD
jgi:hypothetical protein